MENFYRPVCEVRKGWEIIVILKMILRFWIFYNSKPKVKKPFFIAQTLFLSTILHAIAKLPERFGKYVVVYMYRKVYYGKIKIDI